MAKGKYLTSKLRYQNIKKLAKFTGSKLSRDYGIATLYSGLKLDHLVKDGNYLRGIEYLFKIYNNKDLCLSLLQSDKKDPVLNHMLSRSGYYKNEYIRNLINDNWSEIMSRTFYKFIRISLNKYDISYGIKFSTFFGSSIPYCFQKEVLEFMRSKNAKNEYNAYIDITDLISKDDKKIYIEDSDIRLNRDGIELISIALKNKRTL